MINFKSIYLSSDNLLRPFCAPQIPVPTAKTHMIGVMVLLGIISLGIIPLFYALSANMKLYKAHLMLEATSLPPFSKIEKTPSLYSYPTQPKAEEKKNFDAPRVLPKTKHTTESLLPKIAVAHQVEVNHDFQGAQSSDNVVAGTKKMSTHKLYEQLPKITPQHFLPAQEIIIRALNNPSPTNLFPEIIKLMENQNLNEEALYRRHKMQHETGFHAEYHGFDMLCLADHYLTKMYGKGTAKKNFMQHGPIKSTMGDISARSPQELKEKITNILAEELNGNWQERPQKIFLSLYLHHPKNPNMTHASFVVIEPLAHGDAFSNNAKDLSDEQLKRLTSARITYFNSHGDQDFGFQDYEKAALEGAKVVYSHSTEAANKSPVFVGSGSCGPDHLEFMLQLAEEKITNVQEAVRKGLKQRTPKEDANTRIRHGADILAYYNKALGC